MTPTTAAMATSVVAPDMIISHRTLATIPAAAGSSGFSSSVSGSLMSVQYRRREKVVIAGADAGERLDRVLAARIADLSRSRLKALILAGEVAIGGGGPPAPRAPPPTRGRAPAGGAGAGEGRVGGEGRS